MLHDGAGGGPVLVRAGDNQGDHAGFGVLHLTGPPAPALEEEGDHGDVALGGGEPERRPAVVPLVVGGVVVRHEVAEEADAVDPARLGRPSERGTARLPRRLADPDSERGNVLLGDDGRHGLGLDGLGPIPPPPPHGPPSSCSSVLLGSVVGW